MTKQLCYFLLFLLLSFPTQAMQATKQLVTTNSTISIDWLIGALGIALLRGRKRKTKRKKQSKVGKWLRNIAGYIMFGIGGVFAGVMFICCFILAALGQGTPINLPLGSILVFGLGVLLLAVASWGLANLFFHFGKLLLKDEGDYSVPFPAFR